MNQEDRNNTVLIVALIAAGCLVLLCGAVAIFFFLFGFSSPFTLEESPTETTTLIAAQLEQFGEEWDGQDLNDLWEYDGQNGCNGNVKSVLAWRGLNHGLGLPHSPCYYSHRLQVLAN